MKINWSAIVFIAGLISATALYMNFRILSGFVVILATLLTVAIMNLPTLIEGLKRFLPWF